MNNIEYWVKFIFFDGSPTASTDLFMIYFTADTIRGRANKSDAYSIAGAIFIFFPRNVTPICPNLNEFRKRNSSRLIRNAKWHPASSEYAFLSKVRSIPRSVAATIRARWPLIVRQPASLTTKKKNESGQAVARSSMLIMFCIMDNVVLRAGNDSSEL